MSLLCFSNVFGLPPKQKIGVDKFGVQESEIGEERRKVWACIFRVGLKPWKNKDPKNRDQNSPSNFAEKFAGTFPQIRQAKIKNSPQIRSAEPRAQNV